MKGFIGLVIQVFLGILNYLGNPDRIELKKKKIDIKQTEKAKNTDIQAENIKQKLLKEQTQTSNKEIKQERKTSKGPLIGRFKRKRESND